MGLFKLNMPEVIVISKVALMWVEMLGLRKLCPIMEKWLLHYKRHWRPHSNVKMIVFKQRRRKAAGSELNISFSFGEHHCVGAEDQKNIFR